MDKPAQIAFKNMEPSDMLEGLIRERVERLERFHPHVVGCRVVVDVPHRSAESAKVPLGLAVEVELPGRPVLVARESEERRESKGDRTAAISRVFEQVERQLEETARIQRRDVKQHASDGVAGMIARIFPLEDYGFVEVRGSPDLYFTRNAVVEGEFDALEVGDLVHVTLATGEGPMGPQASSVRLLYRKRSAS